MDSIHLLLLRHILGETTPEEQKKLQEWVGDDAARKALLDRLANKEYVSNEIQKRILVPTERPMADMISRTKIKGRKILRRSIAAAAGITAIFAVASYLYMNTEPFPDNLPMASVEHKTMPEISLDKINHGSTKAILTSSNGKDIRLTASDSVMKKIESLYPGKATVNRDIASLSLKVPRGGEFKIILEDSTEVWLNSQSVLVYPETFDDTERRVQLQGEAYFKVTHDKKRPFLVESNEQLVKVYGTSFNIRAYDDESMVYTTLEEGSVSIARADNPTGELKINPGHQTLFSRQDKKLTTKAVDPKVVTSWRYGLFVFEDQPLSRIMKDLSRWYDFEYEFSDPSLADMVFMGSIPRYSDFVSAISILEKIGDLQFSTSNGKVIVSTMGSQF